MIAAEVKEISRRDLDQVSEWRSAKRGSLRRGNRGLQQTCIAHPRQAAERSDDLVMNFANIG